MTALSTCAKNSSPVGGRTSSDAVRHRTGIAASAHAPQEANPSTPRNTSVPGFAEPGPVLSFGSDQECLSWIRHICSAVVACFPPDHMCVEQVVKCRGILRLLGRAPQGRPKGERVRHRHRRYVQSDTRRQPSPGRPSTSAPPDTVDAVTELKPIVNIAQRDRGPDPREFHDLVQPVIEAVMPPGIIAPVQNGARGVRVD